MWLKLRARLAREERFDARLGLVRCQGERHRFDACDPRSGEDDGPRCPDDRLLGPDAGFLEELATCARVEVHLAVEHVAWIRRACGKIDLTAVRGVGGHLAKQKGTIRAAERRHREAIEDRLDGIADGAPGDEIGIVDFEIVALELEPAVDPRRESPTEHQEHAPVVDLWLLLAEPRPARSDRLGMSLRKLPRPRLEGQVELRDFNDVDG